MRPNPIITPGRRPDKSIFPIDTWAREAVITMAMLGGMMGPNSELTPTTAAANSLRYPCLTMAGIVMGPMAAISARVDPLAPPKIMQASTVASPIPPQTCPRNAFAKPINRWLIPPLFINSPASMKRGMAVISKLFTPPKAFWIIVSIGMSRSRK